MEQKAISRILLLLFTSVTFFSCKKDLKDPALIEVTPGATKDPIPAFVFNWETADYMPTPPGAPLVFVPWANGAVKGFSDDIRYDFAVNDGWQLVFNQFNPNLAQLPSNPFFVLYNKYRGLLRVYMYVTTTGFQNSNYLTSGLNLGPNTISSSMLNYIGQDVVDVTVKQTKATQVEPTQIASGVWYASQYEIAYDPAVAASTYQQLGLNWTLKWTNISNVSLGGNIVGTLNGTITTPASSGFTLSGLANDISTGALSATGLAIFQNNSGPNHDGVNNQLGLPVNIFKAMQTGLSSGLSGVVKNIFSGLFGGSSGSTQNVNLTLNAQISLTGTISGSGALIPDPGLSIGVPGTSNSQAAPGLIPYYNSPMGIFNLTARPTIFADIIADTRAVNPRTLNNSGYVTKTYAIDNVNFPIIFNPIITASAQITNMKKEIILYNYGFPPHPPSIIIPHGYPNGITTDGVTEQVGSYAALVNPTQVKYNYLSPLPGYMPLFQTAAVRVSFNVVPNNGSPSILVVKTFIANIVNI